MKITLQDLQSWHPANNYVVLKPEVNTEKISHGSLQLFSPVSLPDGKPYDQFTTQPIVCSVVSVPRKLIFGKRKMFFQTIEELDLSPQAKMLLYARRKEAKFSETTLIDAPIPGSMPHKTTCQVKQGDIVWVNNNALLHAEKQGSTVTCDGQLYYIIKYEDLYLKKSGDNVKMLNGWVLAELIEELPDWGKRLEKAGLIIPDTLKHEQFNDRLGIIKYIDEPVEYLFDDRSDHPEVKVNDMVYFAWKINRRLEPGQKYFAKDTELIVTRRCNILAIMK